MKKPISTFALPLALALGLSAFARPAQDAQDTQDAGAPAAQAALSPREVAASQLPSYPLATCVVSGKELEAGSIVDFVHEGRLYRLCCEDCKAAIEKEPAKYEAKIKEAVIADQKERYPLDLCPVSDEALGSMGDPIDYVDGTKLVRFCCQGCVRAYQKDPAAYMAKIDAAWIESQIASYPLTTCIVMEGDPLSDPEMGVETVDYLYGTRLVRFCCKSCVKKFNKSPEPFLAKLDAAAQAGAK